MLSQGKNGLGDPLETICRVQQGPLRGEKSCYYCDETIASILSPAIVGYLYVPNPTGEAGIHEVILVIRGPQQCARTQSPTCKQASTTVKNWRTPDFAQKNGATFSQFVRRMQ